MMINNRDRWTSGTDVRHRRHCLLGSYLQCTNSTASKNLSIHHVCQCLKIWNQTQTQLPPHFRTSTPFLVLMVYIKNREKITNGKILVKGVDWPVKKWGEFWSTFFFNPPIFHCTQARPISYRDRSHWNLVACWHNSRVPNLWSRGCGFESRSGHSQVVTTICRQVIHPSILPTPRSTQPSILPG